MTALRLGRRSCVPLLGAPRGGSCKSYHAEANNKKNDEDDRDRRDTGNDNSFE